MKGCKRNKEKLRCYGIRNQTFEWFESYLTGRKQLTLLNNVELLHEDAYGVPQSFYTSMTLNLVLNS